MSFAFSAGGTKEETLADLRKQGQHQPPDGQAVLALVEKVIDEASTGNESHGVRFTVNASGHTGQGSLPSMSVQVQSHWVAKE